MTTSLCKVLVTGGDGQLSKALKNHADSARFNMIFLDKNQCDITQVNSVERAFETHQPDIIINTAAYTKVDHAETEKESARLVNQVGAENLARLTSNHHLPLIHLSTDYVFSGEKNAPYHETDDTMPVNVYGLTKLSGEESVRKYNHKHFILRVSGIFSEFGHNFFNTMLKLFLEKEKLNIVSDQITCPTSAHDIAGCLFNMLATENKKFGTYHYASGQACSWYDFAHAIFDEVKKYDTPRVKLIEKISYRDYMSQATRPIYSVLSCQKILTDFGIHQPSWREAVGALVKVKYKA